MKRVFALALSSLLLTSLPSAAEDWTTTDGKTYKDVTVIKVEDDAVTIIDSDGGGLVPLAKLPPDLQKRFHFDPEKAKIAAAQREANNKANAEALSQERQQADEKKQQQLQTDAEQEDAAQKIAALKESLAGSERRILGKVLQKVDGGYLVDCEGQGPITELVSRRTGDVVSTSSNDDPTRPELLPEGTYFLASSQNYVDDDPIDLDVYPAGEYSYSSVLGADKTVRRYADDLDTAVALSK